MSKLLKVTTTKGDTIYIPLEKIYYIQPDKKGRTQIIGQAAMAGLILTETPPDILVRQINAADTIYRFFQFTNKSGEQTYVNITYVAMIRTDKNGNAELECGDSRSSRAILKTQDSITKLLQSIAAAGIDLVG